MNAKRILVIGGNDELFEPVVHEFAVEGCPVDSAAERKSAETLLGQHDYDLVIVHLSFAHGFRGLELLDVIGQCRVRPQTIVLTTLAIPRSAAALGKKDSMPIADIVRLVGMMVET